MATNSQNKDIFLPGQEIIKLKGQHCHCVYPEVLVLFCVRECLQESYHLFDLFGG